MFMIYKRHKYLNTEPGDAPAGGAAGGDGTPAPAAGGTPEPIINPLTADINKIVEKARQQEKSKLYGEIEERKKAAKTAEDLTAARDGEIKTLKQQVAEMMGKIKPEVPEETPKPGKKSIDAEMLNKAIDAAVAATASKFDEIVAASAKRIEELERGNTEKDLQGFKNQLISENKDHIVPELVSGNSRDEIEQSLVIAKQVFARVTQGLKKDETNGKPPGTPPVSKTIQIPPTPTVNDNGAPGAPRVVDVRQLSPADYAKNRTELLKAAAAQALTQASEG